MLIKLGWLSSFHNVYLYQDIELYNLNIYNSYVSIIPQYGRKIILKINHQNNDRKL